MAQSLKKSSKEQGWGDKLIVAAIDFGTAFSGYAYSNLAEYREKATNVHTNNWRSGGSITTKTPTCLLLNSKREFDSFGYEAEQKYGQLAQAADFAEEGDQVEDVKEWHFFQHFKMFLHERKENSHQPDVSIKDSEGRRFPAIEIFTHAIKYLKDHLLKDITDTSCRVYKETDVYFVLTTPAIWSDMAKQFMRYAAENAGIPPDHLRIGLEPECAALYCRTLDEVENSQEDENHLRPLGPGSCYMVVDMGGGTVDIAVHEVKQDGRLCEIHPPSGGPWGGDMVNTAYRQFIIKLVGANVFMTFKSKKPADYLDMLRRFEHKKNENPRENVIIEFPLSLPETYQEQSQADFKQSMKGGPYEKSVRIAQNKFRIEEHTFDSFYEAAVQSIVEHMESVMKEVKRPIDTLLLVGGFSKCQILKDAIKVKFSNKRIINPKDASDAVMKGAILFGRKPEMIGSRICRFTYGIDWNEPFDRKIHPEEKRESMEEGDFCRDIFKKLVERDSIIPYDFVTEDIETGVKHATQDRIEFPFYKSDKYSPMFITDQGCEYMGSLTVCLPKGKTFLEQSVYIKVAIGGTEIRAEARDEKGGKHVVKFRVD